MYFTIRSSSCQCVNPEQRWARAEGATSAHRLRTCLTTRYRTLVSPRTVAALLALHGAAVSGVPPARSVASGSAHCSSHLKYNRVVVQCRCKHVRCGVRMTHNACCGCSMDGWIGLTVHWQRCGCRGSMNIPGRGAAQPAHTMNSTR